MFGRGISEIRSKGKRHLYPRAVSRTEWDVHAEISGAERRPHILRDTRGSLLVLKCSMVERLSYRSADCGSVGAAEASVERWPMLSPDKTSRKDTTTALSYMQMRLRRLWIWIINAYEKTKRNIVLLLLLLCSLCSWSFICRYIGL